ncbi:MAG: ribbon-helix-helix domain-containing protein [Cyanobacteriota bacterium]|nr:ribbon-helix-helix domain-containing protein [Cyanobacteriota bacterium]
MAKQSISISVETDLLEALDQELRHKAHRQQSRSAALAEALELWLQARRVAALRQAYRELGQLEGGMKRADRFLPEALDLKETQRWKEAVPLSTWTRHLLAAPSDHASARFFILTP